MKQKNASPTKEQAEILRRNGLKPVECSVVRDLQFSMIVKNRLTGEFRVIDKK